MHPALLRHEFSVAETGFTQLILKSPDGVLVLDGDGVILFANPTAEAMFARSVTDLVGQVFGFPIVLGEAGEIDLLSRRGAIVAEIRVVEVDWQGQPAYLAMLRDVTEHKRLATALRNSEARLQAVIENTANPIWSIDRQFRLLVGNSAFHTTVERQVGRRLAAGESVLLPEFSAETNVFWRACYERALAGESYLFELNSQMQRPGGMLECHFSPLRDANGAIMGVVGLSVDITERKLADQRLRNSEERLRLVIQNSPDLISVWDERGLQQVLGTDPDRAASVLRVGDGQGEPVLLNLTAADCSKEPSAQQLAALGLDALSTDNWRKMRAAVCRCLNHPGETVRVEYRQVTQSGDVRDLETVYQGFERSGSGREVVSITRDITEHKTLQRILHQANAELEERVTARTAELAATIGELHRANAGKDAFMAAISHELRTPLTGILGMSELLEAETRGPLNPDQLRYVMRIRESGERLLATVNDVLRYTSLMAESAPLEREHCRLLELCASSVRIVQPRAERKRQTVALDVTPPDLTITANADGIINIVTMLLDNAVKFTPDGGAIGVTATLADGVVRLVVWDNGIGMSAEQQQSLFEPFTQADQGLARRFTGTGIGLAYVRKMASLLRGQVLVESEPGQGSRFTVTLPASE